ncbi:hypothetical protein GJ744_011203 [Endocarpon pusillum]|uniref:Uncharacterized protein n=1 Tax=Endocarpon pusillum TaxID=364733 RepID=A0A8H7AH13_9EURO|nr:hypothetical protein GJ744_011203 [Endocarpon pusillum]
MQPPAASTSTRDNKLNLRAMDTPFETKIAAAKKELIGPSKPSIRAVAKKYDLSHQTLARRLKGGIST